MATQKSPYSIALAGPPGSGVTIKSARELDSMREAGRIVAHTLQKLKAAIRPGMRTLDLDAMAEQEIRSMGGKPAFRGYQGFPSTLCVSVNQQIVHGIPGDLILNQGDIVSLDLGAIVDGLYGDSAITVAVGEVSDEDQRLMEACESSLWAGIRQARAGNTDWAMSPQPSRGRSRAMAPTAWCENTAATE